MLIHRLQTEGVAHPPKWLADNTAYLTQMGSVAYGVSEDNSDQDIYGFCLPPKDVVFPWLAGEIPGFGEQNERFNVWDQHHIKSGGREYDFAVYNIVRYFDLCMNANPNMIDSLFTPDRCVRHITALGTMVRERRKVFLSKKVWPKFKGYAYQQLHKMDLKRKDNPEIADMRAFAEEHGLDLTKDWDELAQSLSNRDLHDESNRFRIMADGVRARGRRYVGIAQHGFDVKFAYHVVRLMCEVQQILEEGDLDLQRNREQLKAIRRGEWTPEQIKEYFQSRETLLEEAYTRSNLPHTPNVPAIKELLLNCLEQHYGSISTQVTRETAVGDILADLQRIVERYKE